MIRNSNYIFITLEEVNGEYEYLHRSVHQINDSKIKTADRFTKEYAKSYYDDKVEVDDHNYLFWNDEVCIKKISWEFIDENEFNVLRKYL